MQDAGLKFVVAGPVGAGKTTILRSLSDTPPVSTEMPLADGPMGDKTTTTVALDFATVLLDDGTPLQMFGLPGQEHFSHMRDIVMVGALGVLLLLSASDPDLPGQCRHWISVVRGIDARVPVVVGITRTDVVPGFRMDAIRHALPGSRVPVFTIDARDRGQSSQLVRALLLQLD